MIIEKMQEFENSEFNKNLINTVSKKILKYAKEKNFNISYEYVYNNVLTLMAVHEITPKETYEQICEVCIDYNMEVI